MDEAKTGIATAESNITTMGVELHATEVSINTKEAELDNLFDPVIFTEYQDEINQKRAALKSEISELKNKKTDLETKIKDEEATKDKLTKQEEETQKEIEKYEQESPKDEIQEANNEITRLEGEISTLQSEKTKLQADLEKQRKQESDDAKVYGKLKAEREGGNEMVKWMMDNATSNSTVNKYNNTNWGGAWCAIYTSEMTEALYAEVGRRLGVNLTNNQQLGGSQVAMNSSAYGKLHQSEYSAIGINTKATVDVTNWSEQDKINAVRNGYIHPGMTFQYMKNGNYHTGFIESFNEDLTWNTSEGNSTGGKWGTHVRDANYNKLSDVTDTTLSAYWLAIKSGKMTADEVNKRIGATA